MPIRPRQDRGTRVRTNPGQTHADRVTLVLVNHATGRATQVQTSRPARANLYHPVALLAAVAIMSAARAVVVYPLQRAKSALRRLSVQ